MFKKVIFLSCLLLFPINYSFGGVIPENVYDNFTANYDFEFSGMVVAHGDLTGNRINNVYKVSFSGKTTKFISIFYNLKENIEGEVNIGSKKDVYYRSVEIRPKKKKMVNITFKDENSAKVIMQKGDDKEIYNIKSKYPIFSPISIYIFFMNNKIEISKTYSMHTIVAKKIYRVDIKPIGVKKLNLDKLKRKKFEEDALEVELRFYKVKKGTIYKNNKIKKVIAWISTKPPYIPILIESWHFLGVFSARLKCLKNNNIY